jgi:hypothetical protein
LTTQGSLSTSGWIREVYENGVDFVKQLPPGKSFRFKLISGVID